MPSVLIRVSSSVARPVEVEGGFGPRRLSVLPISLVQLAQLRAVVLGWGCASRARISSGRSSGFGSGNCWPGRLGAPNLIHRIVLSRYHYF